MRLQRALAQAGVASRRAAERLIEEGRVRVDGRVAELGSKVDPARQAITVNGRRVRAQERRWLAFHKPLGVVTTADDEAGRRTVFDFIPQPAGLAYVGRLDVMTTGLLLLTNDGEAVHRLTHPRYRIPRHYTALVHGRPTAEIAAAVEQRVLVDGRPVVTTDVRVRPGHEGPYRPAVVRGDGAQGGAARAYFLWTRAARRPGAGRVAGVERQGNCGVGEGHQPVTSGPRLQRSSTETSI
jgi:23S rRNA pseudouridine2605 synthase